MKVAIVGAGPAGMYLADFLSKTPATQVELYERLEEPFGLLRFGVAPDHAGTKAIARVFERVLERPNVNLSCGVEVGRRLPVAELLRDFDHVVLATGAGQGLRAPHAVEAAYEVTGVDFLRWMNGHPEVQLSPDHSVRRVLVMGHGNVSLDVVRLLATRSPVATVAADAAAWLCSLDLMGIQVMGRGGAGQTRFSAAGLLELEHIAGFQPRVSLPDIEAAVEVSNPDALGVLRRWAQAPDDGRPGIRFSFSGKRGESEWQPDMVVHCIGQQVASVAGHNPLEWARHPQQPGHACVHTLGWASGRAGGTIPDSRLAARQLAAFIDPPAVRVAGG